MVLKLSQNRKGQTSVEYLLLMATAFLSAYLIITGPMSSFTRQLLAHIRSGISNAITHAEWSERTIVPAKDMHPGNPQRTRPVHL